MVALVPQHRVYTLDCSLLVPKVHSCKNDVSTAVMSEFSWLSTLAFSALVAAARASAICMAGRQASFASGSQNTGFDAWLASAVQMLWQPGDQSVKAPLGHPSPPTLV